MVTVSHHSHSLKHSTDCRSWVAYLASVPQNYKMIPKYRPRDGEVATDGSEDEDGGKSGNSFEPQESTSTSKLGATLQNLSFGS